MKQKAPSFASLTHIRFAKTDSVFLTILKAPGYFPPRQFVMVKSPYFIE